MNSLYPSRNDMIQETATERSKLGFHEHFALQNVALLKPHDVKEHKDASPDFGTAPTKVWTHPDPAIKKIPVGGTNKFW
jgi:hypothetical protein